MSNRSTYIPLHGDVFTNKKTIAAAKALTKGDVHKMVGHLARLWAWALDRNDDGNLEHLTDRMIADAAGWKGWPSRFVATLIRVGFINPNRRIHDWKSYGGLLGSSRKADRKRKQLAREAARKLALEAGKQAETLMLSDGNPPTVRVTSDRNVTERNVTDQTVPNRIKDMLQTVSLEQSPSKNSENSARVSEAARTLSSITATREGLYPCVLTPREAEALVNRLLEDHDDALVFAGITSLADSTEGFESSNRAGQTKGIVAWVKRQKPPLLEVVRDVLSRIDGAPELCEEAGIPDDGLEHASNESLNALLDLVRQNRPDLLDDFGLTETRLLV